MHRLNVWALFFFQQQWQLYELRPMICQCLCLVLHPRNVFFFSEICRYLVPVLCFFKSGECSAMLKYQRKMRCVMWWGRPISGFRLLPNAHESYCQSLWCCPSFQYSAWQPHIPYILKGLMILASYSLHSMSQHRTIYMLTF